MQYLGKTESLAHLTSRTTSTETINKSGFLMKLKTHWRRFSAGVFVTCLVILSVLIGFSSLHKLHNVHKSHKVIEEIGVFDKYVGKDQKLSSFNDSSNYTDVFSTRSELVLNQSYDSPVSNRTDAQPQDNDNDRITNVEAHLRILEIQSQHVMDTVDNLTTRVGVIEERLQGLTAMIDHINAAVTSTESDMQDLAQNTNRTLQQINLRINASLNQNLLNFDGKLHRISYKIEDMVLSFKAYNNEIIGEMQNQTQAYQLSLNQSLAKINSRRRFSEKLLSSKILKVEDQFNGSLSHLEALQRGKIEKEIISLTNLVLNQSTVLQNQIFSMQNQLQISTQQISTATAQNFSRMYHSLETCENYVNNSLQRWTENQGSKEKSEVIRLETLLDEQKQDTQRECSELNDRVKANSENIKKINSNMNGFNQKLKGKADAGWIPIPGGYSYFVTKYEMNWVAAQRACENMNATLAHAGLRKSAAMYQFIVSQVVHPLRQSVWIGLEDRKTENQWTWIDGLSLNRNDNHWRIGQPNNYKNQDCVEMDLNGQWGDLSCSFRVEAYALCEKKLFN